MSRHRCVLSAPDLWCPRRPGMCNNRPSLLDTGCEWKSQNQARSWAGNNALIMFYPFGYFFDPCQFALQGNSSRNRLAQLEHIVPTFGRSASEMQVLSRVGCGAVLRCSMATRVICGQDACSGRCERPSGVMHLSDRQQVDIGNIMIVTMCV